MGGPTKTEDKLKPESLGTLGGVQVVVDGMVVGSPQHQLALAAAAAMRRGPAARVDGIVAAVHSESSGVIAMARGLVAARD